MNGTADPVYPEPSSRVLGETTGGANRHEAPPTLRTTFREHRLDFATMERPLKLATGAAAACAVGAATVCALRDVGRAVVPLGVTDGVRTTLGVALFAATLVFLVVGIAYLFTGAVFAHPIIALGVVVASTLLIADDTGLLGFGGLRAVLPGWAMWGARGVLALALGLGVVIIMLRGRRHGDDTRDRHLRAVTLCTYVVLFATLLLILALGSPVVAGLWNFPGDIDLLMVDVALVSVPFLQIAAVDFAEWGAIAVTRVAAVAGRGPLWLVPGLCCLALVVVGVTSTEGTLAQKASTAAWGLLLLGGGLGGLMLVGRALRWHELSWPDRAGFAPLLVLVASFVWVTTPLAAQAAGALTVPATPTVDSSGSYTAAANVRPTQLSGGFTALVPAGWQVQSSGRATLLVGDVVGAGTVRAGAQPTAAAATIENIATKGLHVSFTGTAVTWHSTQADIQRLQINAGPGRSEYLWLVKPPQGGTNMVLLGQFPSNDTHQVTMLLGALAQSIRPPGVPPATIPDTAVETVDAAREATTERVQTLDLALELLLAAACVVIVGRAGSHWSSQLRILAPLLGTFAVFNILYLARVPARTLFGATGGPSLTENGAWAGLGLLGLAALAAARNRRAPWALRLPAALVGLSGGALGLVAMDHLYGQALNLSRVAVWAPIILLVAIAWDVTMSGESMTNRETSLWPRSSRILLFFGYVILVTATVVYYGGQRAAGGTGHLLRETFFEPEQVTQAALTRLALPVILTLFLLRVFGGHGLDLDRAAEAARPTTVQ